MIQAKIEIDGADTREQLIQILENITDKIEKGWDSFSPTNEDGIIGDVEIREVR